MKYALMLIIASNNVTGAATTQHFGTFDSYQRCVEAAVGQIESLRQLYPNATIRWECLPKW